MAEQKYLFARQRLADAIEHLSAQIGKTILEAAPETILRVEPEIYIAATIEQFFLKPLEIARDAMVIDEQFEREVSFRDFGRVLKRRETFARVALPWTGSPVLWHCSPSAFPMNPPAGEIVGQEIHHEIQIDPRRPEENQRVVAEWLGLIEVEISRQRPLLDEYHGGLGRRITDTFTARRAKLSQDAAAGPKLGHSRSTARQYSHRLRGAAATEDR